MEIRNLYEKPISIAPLITFRVIFGAMMAFSAIRFMALGWIEDHFIRPKFHFKYFGFFWVEVLPDFYLYAIHILMIISALGVMIGAFYRLSALLLFLTFTYTELLDLTYYLNHYYFVSIVCGLLIFLPANRCFSVDVLLKPQIYSEFVPAWTINILKFQLGIVYFYAGIAKINEDWLFHALPLKIWLPANDQLFLIGNLLKYEATAYFFSWTGMLYDCTIVFFLIYPKTRFLAYLAVIFFHVITGLMFQIGVFPLVMIGSTLIFFSEKWHWRWIDFLCRKINFSLLKDSKKQKNFVLKPIVLFFLGVHIIFQILFPFRHLFYDGNLFWTEEGYRFSWRVMLMEKAGTATFYVKDSKTGREGEVVNADFLNPHQEKQMAMQPDMILQFAHFLADHYAKKGIYKPEVRAEIYVTLNAKPSRLLVDPSIDLSKIEDTFEQKMWILK